VWANCAPSDDARYRIDFSKCFSRRRRYGTGIRSGKRFPFFIIPLGQIGLGEQFGEASLKLQGHHAMWSTSFACGKLAEACMQDAGLALYDPKSFEFHRDEGRLSITHLPRN
jgi:hypothetical protein